MPLISYNKKLKCGPILSSSCVTWDGGYSGVLTEDSISCDATVENVALVLAEEIQDVKTSLDLTSFTPGNLPFNKNTQEIKDLLQQIANAIGSINDAVADIQTRLTNVEGGDINMTVDLSCLADEISNCETPPIYSLRSILELLISKNC